MNRRSAALIFTVFFLVTAPLFASNMGLALRMQLDPYPQRLHFSSLPYLYTPAMAEALCSDFGGSGVVSSILRWDEVTSAFSEYSCGSPTGNFALEEASGYGVRVALYQSIDTLLVGIHDDSFGSGNAGSWSSTSGPSPWSDEMAPTGRFVLMMTAPSVFDLSSKPNFRGL